MNVNEMQRQVNQQIRSHLLRALIYPSTLLFLSATLLGWMMIYGPKAHAQASQDMRIKIDPVVLIKKSTTKHQAHFKLNERQAVSQMDGMLAQQYASRGRISSERDAYLKGLYHQAAMLLLNGYPIAGGTIISVARNEPAFAKSPVGAGMASFVDAMLQPTDEDPDLLELKQRMERARAELKDMRGDLRFYADLWVVGSIYRDDIAVDAGKAGVESMKATPAERKAIRKALAIK